MVGVVGEPLTGPRSVRNRRRVADAGPPARGETCVPTCAAARGVRVRDSPFARPVVGLVLGPPVAVAAMTAGVTSLGGLAVSTGNARVFLGAVVGGAITITALVFWVRGMLVQLAAGQLPPQLLRWYLDDRFLQSTIGLVLGTFSYGSVVLLSLPGQASEPVPLVAILGAFVLASAALLAVVVTITNSVRTTQESQILSRLTDRAIQTIRNRYPEVGSPRRDQAVVAPGTADEHAVTAPASGWVNEINEEALFAGVPPGSHLCVYVRTGIFVAENTMLASLRGPGGRSSDVARMQSAFVIGGRRDPRGDVELALGQLVDVAVDLLGSDGAGRTSGHEALMHLVIVLKELFSRGEQDVLARDGDRSVEWAARLSHGDALARVFSPLRESGKVTSTVAVTLLRGLGMIAREVRAGNLGEDRLRLLEHEARLLLAQVPGDVANVDGMADPFHVAAEEQLVAHPREVGAARSD